MSGVVVERKLAQGQVVQPADAVFTVADLSRLWVQAEIPEKQSDLVKKGDVVAMLTNLATRREYVAACHEAAQDLGAFAFELGIKPAELFTIRETGGAG